MANIIGYSIEVEEMKGSTCGMIGTAQKGGKKYFCKRFNKPVEPAKNGALSPKLIARNQAEFDLFRKRKIRVNQTLREIAGLGGNIVFPLAETVYDHHWTEFTEYIDGALPEEQYATVINGLDENEKLLVLKIAIGALQTIHGQKIVHGDLKLTNIMLVKNSMGHLVSKIIDFDGAFFEDDVPLESITGTVDYYSPELAIYSSNDDPAFREKISKMITTKSDMFTMGLILHEYLTGEKPKPDHLTSSLQKMEDSGKFIFPWQVLLVNDKGEEKSQLVISDRIKEPAYVALISDMLNPEPTRRPSAVEVLSRLNNKTVPIETDTWPEHHISILLSAAKEKLVGLRKTEIPTKEERVLHAYEIVQLDGRRYVKSEAELISMGVASPAEKYDDPRPEDGIRWNMDALKKAFISVLPESSGRYRLTDRHGKTRIMTVSQLCMLKLAEKVGTSSGTVAPPPKKEEVNPKPVVSPGTDLWPEDEAHLKLNSEELKSKGIEFVGRAEQFGVKGYQFSIKGIVRFVNVQTCKLMKFLIEK